MPPPQPDVLCLNGPNLDRLGTREPTVYGTVTLADLEASVVAWGEAIGARVACVQSNHEPELIEAVADASGLGGIVINPGALTHTSAALADAVAACSAPVVEVHISNIRARDRWRRRSFVAPVAIASIFGRGVIGYRHALALLSQRRRWPVEVARYGPHPDQVMDLRRVDGVERGVVLVHGGFWMDVWGRDLVGAWAVDLAERGIPTAAIEYRRLASGGNAFSTPIDVGEAVTASILALGLTKTVLVGHSAGAHLATTAPLPTVAGVVTAGGLFDLEAAASAGLGEGAVAAYLDSGPAPQPGPPAGGVEMALVHGADDRVVPPSQSSNYCRLLERLGSTVHHQELAATGHFGVLDASSAAWKTVRTEIERLLA